MSEIRVDRFKAEDGISAPQFPNGIQVTGVVTATTLDTTVPFLNVGSNAKLGAAGVVTATSFTGGSFSGTTISVTTGTFSGNVSIGGTLTYEDVTSIDSIGIVTARTGVVSPYADIDDFVSVGSNIHLGNAGIASVSGLKVTGASNFNSNIVATATTALSVTAADESSDTSCNVLFATNDTGHVAPKTGSNLTFNSANGTLTATSFSGSGANLTGIDATAIKDSGGNVKIQAEASGAMYTGIHTFGSRMTVPTATSNPSGAVAGDIYFNTTDNVLKAYNGNSWLLAAGSGTVQGGDEQTYSQGGVNYKSHIITSSGIVTVTCEAMSVDYLIVAGGGGGGSLGGGGGAGGVLTGTAKELAVGT